jgi:hypothetical protein
MTTFPYALTKPTPTSRDRVASVAVDAELGREGLEAQRRLEKSPLSNRELIRKLGTSASQFYRLLDPTNYRKSIRQLVTLLHLLDCEVDFVVKRRRSA